MVRSMSCRHVKLRTGLVALRPTYYLPQTEANCSKYAIFQLPFNSI